MDTKTLLSIALVLTFLTGSIWSTRASASTTTTLIASADTYIDSSKAATNFGALSTAWIRGSAPTRRALLRFNLGSIPAGAKITSATLKLFVSSDGSGVAGSLHAVASSWAEKTVTYATAPQVGGLIRSLPNPASPNGSVSASVTSYVTGKTTVSFYVVSSSSDGVVYYTREKGSSLAPRLSVTWTSGSTATAPAVTSTAARTPQPDPVVMAAGDIVCGSQITTSSGCQQMAVSQVLVDQSPSAVLVLGDLCHTPSADCYDTYYGNSWGRVFSKSRPVPGNHDYLEPDATDYFDYWNGAGNAQGRAGDRSKGYYSFDLGAWHMIALNSNCGDVGGCNSGSAQYAWLQQDLKAHPGLCTLAYWHIPVFSSGGRGEPNMQQVFTLLYDYNADIVLNGHDHIYERYHPINPSGMPDAVRGVREFIAGTGGANHTSIASIQPGSEVRNTTSFGVLKLSLHSGSYDWRFLPAAGGTFSDRGTSACH